MSELHAALAAALAGDESRVTSGDSERTLHAADSSFHRPVSPDVVVYACSTAEVSAVLAVAQERRVPVTPFGAGSSLEGHVIPVAGGISLDLSRMDRIVTVSPGDMTAIVQAGVTRSALAAAAGPHGLRFPVDPGADATLGGMAATNAAGTTTPRYGKMRTQVLGLEAVLAGGEVVRTGSRAPKTSAGYDLTGLLVGSEGTLAVITELTVRLHGIPEQAAALRAIFPTVEAACRAAATAVAVGVGATRLELLDAAAIEALDAHLGYDYPVGHCLLVEVEGSHGALDADLEVLAALAAAEGALDVQHERDPEARARLWRARHDVHPRAGGGRTGAQGVVDRHVRARVGARRRGGVRAVRARPARPERADPRARRRRQRARRPVRRPGRPGGAPAGRPARREPRRRRARPRRHVHGRARGRPGQDRGARARARRTCCRSTAGSSGCSTRTGS